LPKSYTDGGEPLVQPGQNKGLFMMVDAHSDLLSARDRFYKTPFRPESL
jgi:hypothetical protein